MATRLPCRLQLLDLRRLLLRQHLGEHRVDAELLRHRVGHRLRVAGQHHDLDARSWSRRDRLGGLGPDGVGHREGGEHAAALDQVDHALALDGGHRRVNSAKLGRQLHARAARAGWAHRPRARGRRRIACTP